MIPEIIWAKWTLGLLPADTIEGDPTMVCADAIELAIEILRENDEPLPDWWKSYDRESDYYEQTSLYF
jgi:hypothetical protein